jgi:hypothetical protein
LQEINGLHRPLAPHATADAIMICVRPAQAFLPDSLGRMAPRPNCAGAPPAQLCALLRLHTPPLSPPQEHRLMALTDACRLRGWIPAPPMPSWPGTMSESASPFKRLVLEHPASRRHRRSTAQVHLIVDLRSLFSRYDVRVYSLPRRPADWPPIQHLSYIFVHPSSLCSTSQHEPHSLCALRSEFSFFHPLFFHHHALRRPADASFQLALPTPQLKG